MIADVAAVVLAVLFWLAVALAAYGLYKVLA